MVQFCVELGFVDFNVLFVFYEGGLGNLVMLVDVKVYVI